MSKKDIAESFLKLASSGKVREGYEKKRNEGWWKISKGKGEGGTV